MPISFFFLVDKIKFKLWGDSFAKKRRKLPKYSRKAFKGLPFEIEVDGEGGRELQQHEIEMILKDAKSKVPYPQMQVLLLGGNNLRYGLESVDDFIEKCLHLCESLSKLENVQFTLCSLIPSPATNVISGPIFKQTDKKLKFLAQSFPCSVSFLDLSEVFLLKNGDIDMKMFSHDEIHLKDRGTAALANAIFKHIQSK